MCSAAAAAAPKDDIIKAAGDAIRAQLLIRTYRVRGHLAANLDPLGLSRREMPDDLRTEYYGFTDADLDRPAGADELDQQAEELRLLRADLHAGRRMRAGRLADAHLGRGFAGGVGDEVGTEFVVEGGVAVRHGESSFVSAS